MWALPAACRYPAHSPVGGGPSSRGAAKAKAYSSVEPCDAFFTLDAGGTAGAPPSGGTTSASGLLSAAATAAAAQE